MNKLIEKAMLVRLCISQWTARKYDRRISKEVASLHNTSTDAGRYNKVLIAKQAMEAIQQIVSESRTYHYINTLAWEDTGVRLLSSNHYMDYMKKMREYKQEFERIVYAFIENYPLYVEDARVKLNGMFNSSDYPSLSDMRHKYDFKITIDPLPVSSDFRVSLNEEEIRAIQKEIETRVRDAQAIAMRDLWIRLYNPVNHMVNKLKEESAIFRDSLVENIMEITKLLSALNISEDGRLEEMKKEVEAKLCQYTPDVLRKDNNCRKQVVQDAQNILDAMQSYMGGRNER